jgi:hypothetical protein
MDGPLVHAAYGRAEPKITGMSLSVPAKTAILATGILF